MRFSPLALPLIDHGRHREKGSPRGVASESEFLPTFAALPRRKDTRHLKSSPQGDIRNLSVANGRTRAGNSLR